MIQKRSDFMPNGIFGDMFDLNNDGNLDALEQGLEFMLLDDLASDDEDDFDLDDFDSDDFYD